MFDNYAFKFIEFNESLITIIQHVQVIREPFKGDLVKIKDQMATARTALLAAAASLETAMKADQSSSD